MITVLLIIHVFVTLALIGVVLIQRSEGGGLGIGTSQGMGSFMSGRGTANLLTRTTAILATIFMLLSLVLALLNRGTTGVGGSILDVPPAASQSAPSGAPVPPAPETRPVPPPTTAPPPSTVPGVSPSGTAAPPAPRAAEPAGGTAPTPSNAAPAAPPAPATPAPATHAPASGGPSVPTN
jgi:preprotein translocase subunit SecG